MKAITGPNPATDQIGEAPWEFDRVTPVWDRWRGRSENK
jgi:hypothetical protein